MLIEDIIGAGEHISVTDMKTLQTECSQFLHETAGIPLFKALPKTYLDFQRVKVRMQKRTTPVTEAFNQAFESVYANLRQRAVICHPMPSQALLETGDDVELFYVFPTNGYKYVYSSAITNSSSDYQQVLDAVASNSVDIVTELVQQQYTNVSLQEAIVAGAEVIFYNIPSYYAVRMSACTTYNSIITPYRGKQ